MATVVDLTGAEYPRTVNGQAIHAYPGRSLRSAFDGAPIERDALYWEHEGNAAVREGNWKLVRQGAKGKWQLYNLSKDRTEQTDLASKRPALKKQLLTKWRTWADSNNVSRTGLPKKKKKVNNRKPDGASK